MAFKENIMKKFPVSNELSNDAFYNDVYVQDGVNYDGNQKNGRNGSPYMDPRVMGEIPSPALHDYQKREPQAETDGHGGVNWDNTQGDNIEDEAWERQQNVFMKAEGKFKDIHNGFEFKEVDLSKKINVIGMPDESINGNSSDCGYGS